MKKQYFESPSETGGMLPFLNVYLRTNPLEDGTLFEVYSVSITASEAILVSTDSFSLYYPPNSAVKKLLVEALDSYTKNKKGGFQILVEISLKTKNKGVLLADFDQKRFWTVNSLGNYEVLDESSSKTTRSSGNPFLPPAP